ncbi:PREDICTED: uncharacterized protein LOC109467475 isoform X2 [Branchiostoma belcheri]|uniref:Uncharacterized protein LOC109467475 isoform X2 n=1 Tax=Branchiostoma belcheri TaxID=7741 RepID=A0A6P4YQU7_BRABE|nr:PREDICTED: uncharacterized protein LOC109467475 isoform X2 [Branchiostoma belcheri]
MSAFRVALFSRHALRCSRSLSRHYAGLAVPNNRFLWEKAQPTQVFVQQGPARLYSSKDNETPWTDVKYDELKALIKSGHVQLIDVREPEEIASTGLLPGAINIPWHATTSVGMQSGQQSSRVNRKSDSLEAIQDDWMVLLTFFQQKKRCQCLPSLHWKENSIFCVLVVISAKLT